MNDISLNEIHKRLTVSHFKFKFITNLCTRGGYIIFWLQVWFTIASILDCGLFLILENWSQLLLIETLNSVNKKVSDLTHLMFLIQTLMVLLTLSWRSELQKMRGFCQIMGWGTFWNLCGQKIIQLLWENCVQHLRKISLKELTASLLALFAICLLLPSTDKPLITRVRLAILLMGLSTNLVTTLH